MRLMLALALRPLGALLLFGCIALPLRIAFQRFCPEGRIKRFLLQPLGSRH